MPFELFHEPIVPASAAGLTTEELRRYLGVGRNNVAPIARRFGIEKLHGIYPERIVWRQLFGLRPDDEAALAALREPLADINWVSKATGVPQSTIRDHLRSDHWRYDAGVQLGDVSELSSPRLRRWISALIRNRSCGSSLPAFESIPRVPFTPRNIDAHRPSPDTQPPSPDTHIDCPADRTGDQTSEDVFSALFSSVETASRQRRK